MKKAMAVLMSVLILVTANISPRVITKGAEEPAQPPENLLDNITLSSIPGGWSYNEVNKEINVDTFSESIVPFSGLLLDVNSTYEYKMTLNFASVSTYGRARIFFRYLSGDFYTCQTLSIIPGEGLAYGTDIWNSNNFVAPATQPQINLNTDYEVKIVTAPTWVKVYLNGGLMFTKNGIAAGGTLVGLANYNAKFTAKDISLTEMPDLNLLEEPVLSANPDGWSYDSVNKTVTVDTYLEYPVPFRDVLLESSKIFEYKMTLNFASISTYGRARIFFRHASGDFNTCQTLAVIPGEGLAYGTDYWCSGNYAAPASQPQINLNTDYEIKIVTAPTWVKVYLNGVLMLSKDGITSGGTLIGLASYNAKFTAKNISLKEITNHLEDVTLSTTPAGWSYNAASKEINVSSFGDAPVPFSCASLDPAKTYEYKMTLNFSELSTYGMAKIMFRESSDYNDVNYLRKCQVLWVMPVEGLSYGGDYWRGFNYAAPASQPQINLNTDYEVKIITSPTAVTVYFNGVEILSKSDNITAQGNWVGLGAYNAKFTAKNISLREVKRVTRVKADKSSTVLKVGKTEPLTASVSPADATEKEITWSSNNTSIATVDTNGIVTGVAPGTALITVTSVDGGLTNSCMVMVNTDAEPVTFTDYNVSADKVITNVQPETTVSQFRGRIQQTGAVSVFTDINNQPVTNYVGTGTKAEITLEGNTYTYTIVMFGDVDGTGKIDVLDLIKMKGHLLGIQQLEGKLRTAGEISNKGEVSITDLLAIKSHILKVQAINQDVSFLNENNYTKEYLTLDNYDSERYMLPYWKGDLVFNEQILLVEDENGLASAPLLYKPVKILSVRDSSMNIEYKEGIDWELKDGKISVINGGGITPMKYNEFYPNSYDAATSAHRYIDGQLTDKFIRVGPGAYFQPKLLNITYLHADQWRGPIPQYKGELIPKTMAKIQSGQNTNIVVYGDSISHGDEATGFYLTNVPPYMPLWSDMAEGVLKQKYGENVSVTNLSVGGWTSSNGINGGYECYLQENVAGAKERVGSLQPDLVVIGFGHNDGDIAPYLLKANIQKIMDDIHSVSPDTEFIILGVMYPNPEVSAGDVPSYRYYKLQDQYDAALSTLEQNGVAFMPIEVYEDYFYAHKRPQDLHANNINHPNDFLYRFYAQYFCQTLIADFSSNN